jgi:disulfide oxidoreductase YuzD
LLDIANNSLKERKMTIDTNGIEPQKKRFHNVLIDVYPTTLNFERIKYWRENCRTWLSFDLIEKKFGKKIDEISIEEITLYLAKRRSFKIHDLAMSIKNNGIRVPLIVLDDETLLDGNRRYFACSYLLVTSIKGQSSRPEILDNIPVWVIKKTDIDEKMRKKILAEANFVSDCKVPWTLDVQAQVINDYYKFCIEELKMNEAEAYDDILDVYAVEKDKAKDYISSMKLADEFIESASQENKDKFRDIVQDKFVYFWEFKNKTSTSSLALDVDKEFLPLKRIFFEMMINDRFKNLKQIEPMVKAIRDKYLWALLVDSNGSKIDQIEAIYKEQKAFRSAVDKVQRFQQWLTIESEKGLADAALRQIIELNALCSEIIESSKNKKL